MKRGSGVLAETLNRKVKLLTLKYDSGYRTYNWECRKVCWAGVEASRKNIVFSREGSSAEGVVVTLRPQAALTLGEAMLWEGQFLLPVTLNLEQRRDRQVVTAARCKCLELTAQPQNRAGRDALNRPTAMPVMVSRFAFPGVLTEKYSRSEADDVFRVQVQQRVLVTPKAILLRAGDLVIPRKALGLGWDEYPAKKGEEPPYTVRQVLDLDPNRNEYVLERSWDA